MQFPLKPVYADLPDIQNARIRPSHKRLELSVPYDKKIFPADYKGPIKNQKLVSSTVSSHTNFGVGVIRNNEFHISKINDVLQLRPSLKNLSNQNEIVEDLYDSDDEKTTKMKEDLAKKNMVVPLQMRRVEKDKNDQVKLKNFTQLQNEEEKELWHRLHIFSPGK